MLLSAVSVLVVAQSSSEIPEGLMNNPVLIKYKNLFLIQNSSSTASNTYHAEVLHGRGEQYKYKPC